MGDAHRNQRGEGVGDERAVTVRRIGLEAQEAHAPPGADDLGQGVEGSLGRRSIEVLPEDPPHLRVPACTCGRAAGCRGAEVAKVQVVDAGALKVGGESGFREAGAARARHRPDIHQQLYPRLTEGLEEGVNRGALVPDGRQIGPV